MAPAIEVKGVSKRFKLYHEHYSSLKEKVIHFGRTPYEEFWALDGIDFDVEQGSTVGLLGHNGSGKSTLLKCVGGILQPTEGEIVTRGRVAALLELGAGFNPELTGRENVFLNASILGLTKRDTEKVFDEIVAFAELEKFIDMQVRHYSSGMYVRLGFAVAVNVDPDILLVDEVLSVGDEAFQRKCLARVAHFQREGRTILFVTHAADLVRTVCNRAMVLDHGKMVIDAEPGEAVRVFRGTMDEAPEVIETVVDEPATANDDADPTGPVPAVMTKRVRFTNVSIERPDGPVDRKYLLPDEALTVRISYHAEEPTDHLLFGIMIFDQAGNNIFGINTRDLEMDVPPADGDGEMTFEFGRVPLLDGTFFLVVSIRSDDDGIVYDRRELLDKFEVMNPRRRGGIVSFPIEAKFGQGLKAVEDTGA